MDDIEINPIKEIKPILEKEHSACLLLFSISKFILNKPCVKIDTRMETVLGK